MPRESWDETAMPGRLQGNNPSAERGRVGSARGGMDLPGEGRDVSRESGNCI